MVRCANDDAVIQFRFVWDLTTSQQVDEASQFAIVCTLDVPGRKHVVWTDFTDDGEVTLGHSQFLSDITVLACRCDDLVTVKVQEHLSDDAVGPDFLHVIGSQDDVEREVVLKRECNPKRHDFLQLLH